MVSIKRARDFVFQNGALWERSLFQYLFDEGSLHHLQQCLACYKNEDGGFGHGLEHDIKCPESHPLALEFLLTVARDTGVPLGNLLDGTPEWVEILSRLLDYLASTQREDGGWDDEHGLPHWQPYFSIVALLALRNYGVV